MGVNVYDEMGRHYYVGDIFSRQMVEQPLVTEKREVYSFPFGNAELVHLAFSGIYIVYGDMFLYENPKLNFEITGDIDLVEMHFVLQGDGRMKNLNSGKEYHFKTNQHNLHYQPLLEGMAEYRAGLNRYKFFEVHFTTRFFLELAKDSSPSLMRFAEKIANGGEEDLSRENMPISFAMHQCINDIMHANFTGGLKLLFLQSKCIELLTLQSQMYEDAEHAAASSIICKPGQHADSIHYAREYLLQHAAQPPSLTELARVAGINEFKLKQGFKAMFNNTVFGYLADYKLTQARELLVSNVSIKEVADKLGYSSVQHFNSAFRKKFGVPPGKVKKG